MDGRGHAEGTTAFPGLRRWSRRSPRDQAGRRSPRGAARSGSLPHIAWSESSGTADRNLESCGSSPLPYQARSRVEPPRSANVHALPHLDRHARMAYRWSCAAQRVAFLSLAARRSDTPTRATARVRKEPTGSTPKLAHVRQPRTEVINPAWGFLARSKRGTRPMPACVFGGTRRKRNTVLPIRMGSDQGRGRCLVALAATIEPGSDFPIGVTWRWRRKELEGSG